MSSLDLKSSSCCLIVSSLDLKWSSYCLHCLIISRAIAREFTLFIVELILFKDLLGYSIACELTGFKVELMLFNDLLDLPVRTGKDRRHETCSILLMRLRMLKLCAGKSRQVIKQLCSCVAIVATERLWYVLYKALVAMGGYIPTWAIHKKLRS